MGNSSYNVKSRLIRATTMDYMTNSVDDNFKQNKERKIHASMDPKGAKLREARDSDTHPNSVPIELALDLTGSMGRIPQYLVQEGLPKIMAGIIQGGVPDPALLFVGVGDTEADQYPLQVGQFESGDLELDTWLTRTYLEGGGGRNVGESYLLAWYFAAMHTVTDAWEKRKQKGFLFTCGDEPGLKSLPKNVISELMGDQAQSGYTDTVLLAMAQEKWNVYHLHISETSAGSRSIGYWKTLLGQNCIDIRDHRDVSKHIIEIVTQHTNQGVGSGNPTAIAEPTNNPTKSEEIYL